MKTITLWKLKAFPFSGEVSPKREIKYSKFENEFQSPEVRKTFIKNRQISIFTFQ
jgi:hypothetical protein